MRKVVLPWSRQAVMGGIMLGTGRALGETMAVTFVIGNSNRLGWSLFAPSNTIASLIALEFPEFGRQPQALGAAGAGRDPDGHFIHYLGLLAHVPPARHKELGK